MRRFNFSEKGFTLIELIVVMLIIGFSSSLVFLNFKSNSDVDDKRFALYFVRILEQGSKVLLKIKYIQLLLILMKEWYRLITVVRGFLSRKQSL